MHKTAYALGLGIPAEPLFRSELDAVIHLRIEALKPAIEACGISTLSQSPMLGFHKQMDNRIKRLEEIQSFRMQGRSEERRVGKESKSRWTLYDKQEKSR